MKKFKIPSIPPTTNKCIRFPNDVIDDVEKAIKCIRFPNDVIDDVEKAIKGKDCTFTAFVVEAVKVALDNLKEYEK